MLAFEIEINGDRLRTAGFDQEGVLSAIVSWVERPSSTNEFSEVDEDFTVPEEELSFSVEGLTNRSDGANFHLRWVNRDLQVGNRICIKIVQAAEVDPPRQTEQEDSDFIVQQERKYYEELKQKYGD